MTVDVAPASLMLWHTARIYIRGAVLGHAGLDLVRSKDSPGRGLTKVLLERFQTRR